MHVTHRALYRLWIAGRHLQTTNWKRGFFRLWLVASLGWIGFLSLSENPVEPFMEWTANTPLIVTVPGDYQIRLSTRTERLESTNEIQSRLEKAYQKNLTPPRDLLKQAYGSQTARSDDAKDAAIIAAKDIQTANAEAIQKGWRRLSTFGYMALAPPLAALALWYLVGWILSGFRQELDSLPSD